MTANIVHWVDGEEFAGTSEFWGQVTNPATGEQTGRVALASARDAEYVIESSVRAATGWANTSLTRKPVNQPVAIIANTTT